MIVPARTDDRHEDSRNRRDRARVSRRHRVPVIRRLGIVSRSEGNVRPEPGALRRIGRVNTHLPLELDFLAALLDLERGHSFGTTARRLELGLRSIGRAFDEIDPGAPRLGIDLRRHREDVRRLTYSYAGATCGARGWDFDDFLQDVCAALLVRNRGICPYDPRKGALSTYVVRVVRQLVSNRLRKENCRVSLVPEFRSTDEEDTTEEVLGDAGEYEELIDARRTWLAAHDANPELVEALIESGGTITEAAARRSLRRPDLVRVKSSLVGSRG